MSFIPYTPPNEGTGLLRVDRDLCWRINPRGLVSPAVIGAICWARNHFRMSDEQQDAVLNGLGLEYYHQPSGGVVLRPKSRHRVALFRPMSEPEQPAKLSNAASFPTFALSNPLMPLAHYDAVEVVPGVEGTFGIGHYEDHDVIFEEVPHFWSVQLHLEIGSMETVGDFPKKSQADAFANLMRDVIRCERQAAGRDPKKLSIV